MRPAMSMARWITLLEACSNSQGLLQASPVQTQPELQAPLRTKLGTSGCGTSLDRYGMQLNRITRVSASAACVKPFHNLVKVAITWATSGSERSK